MTAAAPSLDVPRRFTHEDQQELPEDLVADLLERIRGYRNAPIAGPEEMATKLELETGAAIRWDRPFGCVLVQLEGLDATEREYGASARARALREAARRVREIMRTNDKVGYWGPDTLMVVLPATWSDGAAVVADRIDSALSVRPVALGRRAGAQRLTASVGAAGWSTSMTSAEDMWREAFCDVHARRAWRGQKLAFVANL
jgi:diguanylate cyclase (GGDEF)-like protein